MQIYEPRAIYSVEQVFGDAAPEFSQLVVDWMTQIDSVESSQVLARYGLLHPIPEIRSSALKPLKARPLHDFVPDLLDMAVSPVRATLVPVFNRGRTLAGYRQAFAQETEDSNRLLVVDTVIERYAVKFISGEGAALSPIAENADLATLNRLIEQSVNRKANEDATMRQMIVQRDNAAINHRNARLCEFLSELTGQELPSTAAGLWKWWLSRGHHRQSGQKSHVARRGKQADENERLDFCSRTGTTAQLDRRITWPGSSGRFHWR